MGGYRYFITFIDYLSCYGHVELICEKLDSLVAFKEFKVKMELQKNKKVEVVRPNRGGEFYGRFDETGWNSGHSQFIYVIVALMCNTQCLELLRRMA